jgi:hypothetical protein
MPATSELLTFAAIGDLHVREDRTSLYRARPKCSSFAAT